MLSFLCFHLSAVACLGDLCFLTPPSIQEHMDVVRLVEQAAMPRHLGFESVFNVRVFGSKAHSLEGADEAGIQFEDRFHTWVSGHQFRTERWSFEAGAPRGIFHQTSVWTDGRWASWNDMDPVMVLHPFAAPTELFGYDLEFDRIGERFLDPELTLPALVRASRPLAIERESRKTIFRWAPRDAGTDDLWNEIQLLELDNQTLVTGLRREVTNQTSANTSVRVRQSWTVDEWVDLRGWLLPAKAHLDIEQEGAGPDRSSSTRTVVYTRESIRSLPFQEGRDSIFTLPLRPGTNVLDGRINVKYDIAGDWISLDGISYKPQRPINGIVEEELFELIESARQTGAPEPAITLGEKGAAIEWRWRESGAILGISMGVAVLLATMWPKRAATC